MTDNTNFLLAGQRPKPKRRGVKTAFLLHTAAFSGIREALLMKWSSFLLCHLDLEVRQLSYPTRTLQPCIDRQNVINSH